MIPPPKLDDRTFHDIVEEAISMIPRYAPEWTNHNPSDPGITLIELAAWMTDLLIYRLNQVPDKNYVAFLNLLGIKLRAPRAAKALAPVHARRGRAEAARPARHAGVDAAGDRRDDRHVRDRARRDGHARRVPTAASRTSTRATRENSRYIDPAPGTRDGSFEVFAGAQRIERFLYLSDPRFANAGESVAAARLPRHARARRPRPGAPPRVGVLGRHALEGDGARADRGRSRRGRFIGPLRFEPTTVNHIEGLWMRGRLAEVPGLADGHRGRHDPRAASRSSARACCPTQAFANLDNNAFLQLDLGKNIYPFGKEPKVDCLLYLACDELLQTADAYISIEMALADSAVIPRPNPSDQLVLAWEYWDGKRWRHLGRTAPRGALPGAGDEHGFHDDTKAMSQSGTVSFRRPKDMEALDINGVTKKLGPRSHREGRLRRAGHVHARQRASGSSRTTARCGRPRCAR